MSYGLTSAGFVIPTLETIIAERLERCKEKYGEDFQAADDNILWQHELIDAERELQAWQMQEAVYYAQTVSGAEGIYLDDALGLRGFYRDKATASNGYVVITSDNTISNEQLMPTTTNFNSNTGVIYRPDTVTTFSDRVVGQLITYDDFVGFRNYTFSYNDADTGTGYTLVASVDGSNNVQVTNYMFTIRNSLLANTSLTEDEVFITDTNTDNVALYIGYSTDGSLVGVSKPSNYKIEPVIGLKSSSFFVIANKVGFYPLSSGGIISASPSNVAYSEVTNLEQFSSGSNVESDTIYRLKAASQTGGTALGSEARLIEALEEVDGVVSATIFPNPSVTPKGGVDGASFEAVVTGGATADIAEAIYKNKAITDNTSGQISYGVLKANGVSETISFSRSTTVTLNVKVNYTTTTGVVLSSAEQDTIKSALETFSDSFTIGGKVFNFSLMSTVSNTLSTNRLDNLIVEVKRTTDPESAYTTANIQAENREIFTIDGDDVIFTRI